MYYLFLDPYFCQQRIQNGGGVYLIGKFLSSVQFLYVCRAYRFTNSGWIFGNMLNKRTSMHFGLCILISTGTLNRQPRVVHLLSYSWIWRGEIIFLGRHPNRRIVFFSGSERNLVTTCLGLLTRPNLRWPLFNRKITEITINYELIDLEL